MPVCYDMVTNPEKSVGKPYFHSNENVKEHLADLSDQAKNPRAPREGIGEKTTPMQHVVFDVFSEALKDPNHPLRQEAEKALGGFAQAAQRRRGISASSASREFNAPTKFFIRWAKQFGIIPILEEGKGQGSAMILDRAKAQEAADIYHKAKQQGVQPKKYLERISQR
jgi:hypothetical protein